MTEDDTLPSTTLLTSDELGDVGESTFRALCSKGPLIANGSGRDRAGWDFVVQAPAENAPTTSLDDRTVLWTSYVQVKAAWKSRKPRVRLTLSAAEMLAKQTDPAFVVALFFDRRNLENFDLYMVEMTGDRLAAILKALREHERDGAKAINASHTYISLRSEERLRQATGPAIRERLAKAHRGTAPETYAAYKSRELRTIGYDERPIRGVITLHDIDLSGLFDVLLGKRSWKASLSSLVETRFGVDLPIRNVPEGLGSIRLSPARQAACDLVVMSSGSSECLTFTGDHHYVAIPGPHGLVSRSRFCFPGFVVEHEGSRILLETTYSKQTELPLADWRRFWRLMDALRNHQTDFALRPPRLNGPVQWRYFAEPDQFPREMRESVMVVEAAHDLAENLNLKVGPISMQAITRQSKAMLLARHLGNGRRPKLQISMTRLHRNETGHDRSAQDGIYIDFVDIGDQRVGFSTRLRLTCRRDGDDEIWESSKERRLEIRRIGSAENDFATFTEEAKSLAGTQTVFLGDIDHNFLRRALGEIHDF